MNPDHNVMGDMTASAFDLLLVVLLAVVIYGLLYGGRLMIDLLPLSASSRQAAKRVFPIVGATAALLGVLFAAGILFRRYPEHFPIAVAVILAVAIAASWFGVRDVVAGVFVRAGRVCGVGDHIRIGSVEGRVRRMGARSLTLETARGEDAILPYSQLTRDTVIRTSTSERWARHVFEVDIDEASVAEAKRRVRAAAVSCHWAAIARRPEVLSLGDGRYEVTVFSLDPDRAGDLERAVRTALE